MYIKDGRNKDYGTGKSYLSLAHDLFAGKTEAEIIEECRMGGGSPSYPNVYAWGWLGDKVTSPKWKDAELKQKVLDKLRSIDGKYCVDLFCG